MTTPRQIFDKALSLRAGQTLLVPCFDVRQQESTRVALAYQRRVFLDSTDNDFDIIASKVTRMGVRYVAVKKVPRINTAIIIDEDGSETRTSLIPTPLESVARDAVELARIRKAMAEDGHSPEAIDAYLRGEEVSKIDTSGEDEDCNLPPEILE